MLLLVLSSMCYNKEKKTYHTLLERGREMTLQQKKAKEFAEALRIWDQVKRETEKRVKSGRITEERAHKLLRRVAKELDL